MPASETRLDTNSPQSLPASQGIHHSGTYTTFPDPNKRYIVYTDASDDTCRGQLSQEHDGTEFPIAFLLHIFFGHTEEMEHN